MSDSKSKFTTGPILDEETANVIYNKLLNEKDKRNPTVKKNWGSDEVKLLEYAVSKYLGKAKHNDDKLTTHDWKEIANFVPGRTESQCLYKWNLTKHKVSFRKSTWQNAEDNILKQLVMKHGKKHWQKIANELNDRMGPESKRAGKQCRERWLNHLDERIRKEPWSEEEDLELLLKQWIIGNKWSDIVKYLPGRTENMVKNRFNTLAKQKREEKRNNCVKKLDEVIGSLEENKTEQEDQYFWIKEKIKELKTSIENKGENKSISLMDRSNKMSMEEKKQVKYEQKQNAFMNHPKDNSMEQVNTNYNNKPQSFDHKDEGKVFYETTPQQYLNRRSMMDQPMSSFVSPYGVSNRQLSTNVNWPSLNQYSTMNQIPSPSPMKFTWPTNKIDSTMLSPQMSSNAKNYLKHSLDSPCCISARSSVLKLLKTCNKDNNETDKIVAVKQLLNEFRDFENSQKDKVIFMLDKMISQKDFGTSSSFNVSSTLSNFSQ